MSDPASHPRTGRNVGLVLALALGVGALGGVGPAIGANPVEDCAAPFPVADLAAGDALTGLTVTRGSTPQGFTAEVIGTLQDGIGPDLDMVIVEVDPAGLGTAEVKGIWQGMSGSPVYAADGRLVGAISYGLSTQQSWIAGVTPFADMDDYVGATPAARVAVDHRTAARVASAAGISTARAAQGFVQLPTPLAVAGVSSRFLHPSAAAVAAHPWLRADTYAAGRAGAAGPDAATMVAGGNMAAAVSTGDVLMAGVGTVTSVCHGDIVGFGHPMSFLGDSSMTLHPADALYVQGDAPSFKVANIGEAVGTVFGDHMTGLTGRFGPLPATTAVSSTVSWDGRTRTGTSYVSSGSPDDLAMATYLQGAMNHARVIDGTRRGSEVLALTVSGTDAAARPFTLSWTDRFLAGTDLSDEVGMTVAGLAESISSMPDVTVGSIAATGRATASTSKYRVARLEQRRAGAWVRVGPRMPALARSGRTIKVRAVLRGGKGPLHVPFSFRVPKRLSGQLATLGVAGGQSTTVDFGDTIAKARRALGSAVRSDTVRAQFGRVTHSDVSDYDDEDWDLGFFRGAATHRPSTVKFVSTKMSHPFDAVVSGSLLVPVAIR
jgi:hypothetical protein